MKFYTAVKQRNITPHNRVTLTDMVSEGTQHKGLPPAWFFLWEAPEDGTLGMGGGGKDRGRGEAPGPGWPVVCKPVCVFISKCLFVCLF